MLVKIMFTCGQDLFNHYWSRFIIFLSSALSWAIEPWLRWLPPVGPTTIGPRATSYMCGIQAHPNHRTLGSCSAVTCAQPTMCSPHSISAEREHLLEAVVSGVNSRQCSHMLLALRDRQASPIVYIRRFFFPAATHGPVCFSIYFNEWFVAWWLFIL
jgi:hypothetical protein